MELRGGFLDLESTTFYNNSYAIHFVERVDYGVIKSTFPSASESSRFVNLHFNVVDFPYPVLGTDGVMWYFTSTCFVRIIDAEGVSFRGCSFELNAATDYYTGIEAINSDFRVVERAASSVWGDFYLTYIDKSSFENLDIGIKAAGDGSFKRVIVQNTDAKNSSSLISLSNFNFPKVVNNKIENARGSAIRALSSTGYEIANNNFFDIYYGIDIDNSGGLINMVSNNIIYDAAAAAIYAEGVNKSYSTIDGGLKFFCNDMSKNIYNMYDIYVQENSGHYGDTLLEGVSPIQGFAFYKPSWASSPGTYSAGNLFSLKTPDISNPYLNFYNRSSNAITYLHGTIHPKEIPVDHNLTSIQQADNNSPCQFGNKSTFKILGQISTKKAAVFSINSEIQSVLSQSNLTLSDSFYVDSLAMARHSIIDTVVQHFLYNDSDVVKFDSLIYFFDIPNMPVDYVIQLSELYLTIHDFDAAKNVITTFVANNQSAHPALLEELNRLAYLYDKVETLYLSSDDWASLPSNDKDSIRTIAQTTDDVYSTALAQYLLVRYTAEAASVGGFTAKMPTLENESEMNIFPNPAQDKFYIEIANWKNDEVLNVEIYDNLGRCVKKEILKKQNAVVDISQLSGGLYIIHAKLTGQKLKFVSKIIKK